VKPALRLLGVVLLVIALMAGAVGSVRWAKRGGRAANLMASAMMLGLGMGIVVQPPQRGVEQAQQEADKSGDEAGGPLSNGGA
jgi:hypothetical protein